MILGFTQKINGKPTYFPEKIISGLDLPDYRIMTLMDGLRDVNNPTDEEFYAGSCNPLFDHVPKLHTIRGYWKNSKTGQRSEKQWEGGELIHPFINVRKPNQYQFAPAMPCKSVQQIKLGPDLVWVDERLLEDDEVSTLAINDGFKDAEDFYAWFNGPFDGQIIHWTDLKY